MAKKRNDCPCCGSKIFEKLYEQSFANITGLTFLHGYDVVCCTNCGLSYAIGIPSQLEFDEYYLKQCSKYDKSNFVPKEKNYILNNCFEDRLKRIEQYINTESYIAEIGCATGDFLAYLKNRKYINLEGIDPSERCVTYMRDIYGISAKQATFSEIIGENSYDLLMLIGVMEHIIDLDLTVKIINKLVKDNGVVYLEVPAVENFTVEGDLPFQEFSTEHVNFFSLTSICNVFEKYGFIMKQHWSVTKIFGDTTSVCLCLALCKNTLAVSKIKYDYNSKLFLKKYIKESYLRLEEIESTLKILAEDKTELVIWGIGTYTLMLLEKSSLKNCNIKIIIDSNPLYQGYEWSEKGVLVCHPEKIKEFPKTCIFIATHRYKTEIMEMIKNSFGLKNEVLFL